MASPRQPYPIVVMLTSFDVGGTEKQTVELVRRLEPRRLRVHVACFHERGPLRHELPDSLSVTEFPLQGFRRAEAVRQLARFVRLCRRLDARLVHTCDLYANVFGLTGAGLARVPSRIGSRREVLTGDKSRAELACQRVVYRAADVVVANSRAASDQLMREGVAAEKTRLIPNGVDVAAFTRARTPGPIRRIVMVANLRPEKGHDVLIEAAPHIRARHPDVRFTLAGDGPRREALECLARARGVASGIEFLGQADDVPALLAESDLFVLPSRSEAMPNAVIEAMAAGLPVVASRVGGIPELVADGRTGVLVPAGDPAALARAIVELMDRPAHAGSLGRAARAHIERGYSLDRMVDAFERLYLEQIEGRARISEPAPTLAASRSRQGA